MSDRPLLFLDLDGVLAAFPESRPKGGLTTIDGLPLLVPEGTRGRVARLLECFEPVWATAWQGRAHGAWREHLGLARESWPYLSYSDLKLPEIIRFAEGRRFVWIDDDAEWELGALGWKRSMVAGLILAPDTAVGLLDEHVEQALSFEREGAKA